MAKPVRRALLCLAILSTTAGAADKAKPPPAPTSAPSTVPGLSAEAGMACQQLSIVIENAEKEIAWNRAFGMADNSAPRETNRLLTKLSLQELQSQHLAMMVALGCPTLPLNTFSQGVRYLNSAMQCNIAYLKKGAENATDECRRSEWKPDIR